MKDMQLETKLSNAENCVDQINNLSDQIKANAEFAEDSYSADKVKQLANDAKNELKNAKQNNQ